ncbi:hypothetical protein ONZ45_g15515 [Pleurotus djamor]|nr:hypothetical protein ONZ45_g15515 [Pleurotus djamor]
MNAGTSPSQVPPVMIGNGTPSSFTKKSPLQATFGGRSLTADDPLLLSPTNASGAFLPGVHQHYLDSKAKQQANGGGVGLGPALGRGVGMRNASGPGVYGNGGGGGGGAATPAGMSTSIGNYLQSGPGMGVHTFTRATPYDPGLQTMQAPATAAPTMNVLHQGQQQQQQPPQGMGMASPTTRALQTHAPGQSLPQGLAAGYSRIHALPPPKPIVSPGSSTGGLGMSVSPGVRAEWATLDNPVSAGMGMGIGVGAYETYLSQQQASYLAARGPPPGLGISPGRHPAMSIRTMRVIFPTTWPGWHTEEFLLYEAVPSSPDSVSSSSSSASSSSSSSHPGLVQPVMTIHVDENQSTDYGSDSPVFHGKLTSSSSTSSSITCTSSTSSSSTSSSRHQHQQNPIHVVLKFALRADLIPDLVAESFVYQGPLLGLQGKSIPRSYGLFENAPDENNDDGQRAVACLVLEDWGECLKVPFAALDMPLRLKILHQLVEIHNRGWWHGDFAERNVLEREGEVRIIDFGEMEVHACALQMKTQAVTQAVTERVRREWWNGNGKEKERPVDGREFGCERLWEVCTTLLALWS